MPKDKIRCILDSYKGYLSLGNCYKSYHSIMSKLQVKDLKDRVIDVNKPLLSD